MEQRIQVVTVVTERILFRGVCQDDIEYPRCVCVEVNLVP
jgi:hypothetical protein